MNSTSRRTFLKNTSLAALSLPFMSMNLPVARSRKWGIILNTVQHQMESDPAGTLEKLAEMGYKYIEGNVYGDSTEAYGKLVKSLGLNAIGGGGSMGDILKHLPYYIQNGQALGHSYLCCYWPWMSDAKNLTVKECMETAERLNRLGKFLKRQGLRLAFHNHDKEFVKFNDITPYDILLSNTDPDYVTAQMDLYWVYKGNADPLVYFDKYPGRFELFHVKDMAKSADKGIECVGAGTIDFVPIFAQAKLAGLKYATVEHEKGNLGLDCAGKAIEYLNGAIL